MARSKSLGSIQSCAGEQQNIAAPHSEAFLSDLSDFAFAINSMIHKLSLSRNVNHEPCYLLKLPGELRNRIYEYVLTSPEGLRWDTKAKQFRGAISAAILYTCHQIRNEAITLPLRLNKIALVHGNCKPRVSPIRPNTKIYHKEGRFIAADETFVLSDTTEFCPAHFTSDELPLPDFLTNKTTVSRARMLELIANHLTYALTPNTLSQTVQHVLYLRLANPLLKINFVPRFGCTFLSFDDRFWEEFCKVFSTLADLDGLERWEEWVAKESNSKLSHMQSFSKVVRGYAEDVRRIKELQDARESNRGSGNSVGGSQKAAEDDKDDTDVTTADDGEDLSEEEETES